MKIAFVFGNVAIDGDALTAPWQRYLRIIGDFRMEVGGVPLYKEEQFCLVEFAIQSQIWAREASEEGLDFTYTSMEAEEQGLVWIRLEQGGWKVGSVFQKHTCPGLFSLEEIVVALNEYYEKLRRCCNEEFNIDIVGLFAWAKTQGHQ